MTQHRRTIRSRQGLRSLPVHLFLVLLLFLVALTLGACSSRSGVSPAAGPAAGRDVALRQIAAEYAATGDLKQAQAALDKLNLANPGQLLLSLVEADLSAGRAREDIEAGAHLAEMLGARSQRVAAYLTPSPEPVKEAAADSPAPAVLAVTVAAPTTVPATATSVPPTVAPTATLAQATATSTPPTNSPTPEPQNPRVMADKNVNLRGGPGQSYGVVGQLRGGQGAPIIGRNASGDWWQVQVTGIKQAWVAGTVIRVLGALDTVAVAQNIPPVPTAAPRPTAAPQPTAAPAAPSGPVFKLVVYRLWTVEETGGFLNGTSVNCGYQHNLHVYVKDAGGNLLNGVTIKEVGGIQQELVSGSKAPGMAEFDLYPPGKDVLVVRDVDGRAATSDTGAAPTRPDAMSFDTLRSGHYCSDDADCAHFVGQRGCYGHFSWDFVFQRNY